MTPAIPSNSELIATVFDHWKSLWAPGVVPKRSAIDPTAIPKALTFCWIYRLEDDGDFYCILAGEEINLAWGRRIKGLSSREIIGDDHVEAHPRWLTVINRPAIYFLSQSKLDMPKKTERLVLPVAEDDGSIRCVFGVSHYEYEYREVDDAPRAEPGVVYFWDARTLEPIKA